MTTEFFSCTAMSKTLGDKKVLDNITLRADDPTIIGLVGLNGSGKTTLLRHIVGLYLPTSGDCSTFGTATRDLGAPEFSKIGMVHQHDPLIDWMDGDQLLQYVASFHANWDAELERTLVKTLAIDISTKIASLSPGNRQKLALTLAVCHHPSLLLLDEPLSDLDPLARAKVIATLLECFRREEMVIMISSHMLYDLETIADRIVCLDGGRVAVDAPLDELKEEYGEATGLPMNLDRLFSRLIVGAAA